MELLLTLGFIIILVAGLYLLTRRQQQQPRPLPLRPLTGMEALGGQVGQAIESGSRLHVTLGQGNLASPANPASVASLAILDELAKDGCASGIPPIVTVGDGTMLPAAQDSLRQAFRLAGRPTNLKSDAVQFLAANAEPFAYAGGGANIIQREKIMSNVMVGRFGPELMIMAEAAERRQVGQVIGSDDPTALAVATAVTDNILIGEELFAASTYLDSSPARRASLQLQDLLRYLVALLIILAAIAGFFLG